MRTAGSPVSCCTQGKISRAGRLSCQRNALSTAVTRSCQSLRSWKQAMHKDYRWAKRQRNGRQSFGGLDLTARTPRQGFREYQLLLVTWCLMLSPEISVVSVHVAMQRRKESSSLVVIVNLDNMWAVLKKTTIGPLRFARSSGGRNWGDGSQLPNVSDVVKNWHCSSDDPRPAKLLTSQWHRLFRVFKLTASSVHRLSCFCDQYQVVH